MRIGKDYVLTVEWAPTTEGEALPLDPTEHPVFEYVVKPLNPLANPYSICAAGRGQMKTAERVLQDVAHDVVHLYIDQAAKFAEYTAQILQEWSALPDYEVRLAYMEFVIAHENDFKLLCMELGMDGEAA